MRNSPHRGIRVPGPAGSIRGEAERLKVLRSLREAIGLAVTKYPNCVRELDRKPDRAIWSDNKCRWNVRLHQHWVFGEPRFGLKTKTPHDNSQASDD